MSDSTQLSKSSVYINKLFENYIKVLRASSEDSTLSKTKKMSPVLDPQKKEKV